VCVLELEAEGGGRKWEGGLDKAGLSGENRCSSPVRQFASSPVRQFASSPVRQFASSPVRQFASSGGGRAWGAGGWCWVELLFGG
jgi:hypothetical protein